MGKILDQAKNRHIIAFKNNNQKVMQEVYQNTFPKFRSYVQKNSGDEIQAKDVYQEAFISCWRNIKEGKLKQNSNVEGYLFSIAKNKWIDYLRSSDFKRTIAADSFSHLTVVSDEQDNEEHKESQLTAVLEALKQLKDGCKSLLEQFYFERKSMNEISKVMNLAPASARNQKYRCMEKLRVLSLELRKNG